MAHRCLLFCLLIALSATARAWTNHAPGSVLALAGLAEVADRRVVVEPLEDFLRAERAGLVKLFAQQDAFSREHFPQVPAAPASLRWTGDAQHPQRAFLQALRVNPHIKLGYFIQNIPGSDEWQTLAPLAASDVLVYTQVDSWQAWQFYALTAGQSVSAMAVLASAADEPDYGHDIHLFEDNPGAAGQVYQFGAQPFGDSRFEHSSQAPFHMGFYHESPIIFALGGFLKNTFADWRAYQYLSLARFAFNTGHDYWGYRFLGWGLHYVQDLTQPFHATVLPGSSTPQLLWIYLQDGLGFSGAKHLAIARNADFHTYVETLQFARLQTLLADSALGHPLITAYADESGDAQYPAFGARYVRLVIAAQARASADQLDALIALNVARYPEADQLDHGAPLETQLVQLTRRFGAHSRAAVNAVLAQPQWPMAEMPANTQAPTRAQE
jgi:hypothetical protein